MSVTACLWWSFFRSRRSFSFVRSRFRPVLALAPRQQHSLYNPSFNNPRALTPTLAPVLAMSAPSPHPASPKPASLPPLEAGEPVIGHPPTFAAPLAASLPSPLFPSEVVVTSDPSDPGVFLDGSSCLWAVPGSMAVEGIVGLVLQHCCQHGGFSHAVRGDTGAWRGGSGCPPGWGGRPCAVASATVACPSELRPSRRGLR